MIRPTLTEVCRRINEHLKTHEADKEWNQRQDGRKDSITGKPSPRYWYPGCGRAGAFAGISYVRYQGWSHITREQAERYLAWLDAGNRGTHYECFRDHQPQPPEDRAP